jgi:alkenylglycerophosphocholine/alkenylglycerophosphoethanolamine hydrolase
MFAFLAIVSMFAYLVIETSIPSFDIYAKSTIKVFPVLFLALHSFKEKGRGVITPRWIKYSSYITYGLILSGIGDVVLELEDVAADKDLFFLIGLASFLLAHLCYIIAFYSSLTNDGSAPLKLDPYAYIPLGVLWVLMLNVLIPAVNMEMKVPVFIYTTIIVTMGIMAISRWNTIRFFMATATDNSKCRVVCSANSSLLACAGAISFMLSDSVLGIDKFVIKIQNAKLILMVLYFTGQSLISFSSDGEGSPYFESEKQE